MDNLSLFGKSLSTLNTVRMPTCNVSRSSWSSLPYVYEVHSSDVEGNDTVPVQEENKSMHYENQSNDSIRHVGHEDVSMSFLSLSLK